ncbi:hypothetical protein Cgig2_001375 [Carnegiea gigantea]|uniref:Peptidase C14 caspase domain-containing protein n=1 Tax=Carnegiea gigantea TaxID=171969 RepID=A0A9Q1KU47_9CARY|nr:hypothetical protein Cgig2_001375 [Carnegiea gigantea]
MEELGAKRLAVLVGCNYPNTENELHGCINDVLGMKQVLIERFGFKEEDIELMIDEPTGSSVMPTGANIKKTLRRMIHSAKEGDVLYFHYSGHGTLIPSLKPNEPHRKDEAIVPCDFNLITDMDFRELVNQLPPKTTLTILSDSCHSGGLIDQEKEQIGPSTIASRHPQPHHSRPKLIPFESILEKLKQLTSLDTPSIATHMREQFKEEASLSFCLNEATSHDRAITGDYGILLSGCQANETSADAHMDEEGGKAYGAFSNAVRKVLEENPGRVSNKEVVIKAREVLHKQGFRQHPYREN